MCITSRQRLGQGRTVFCHLLSHVQTGLIPNMNPIARGDSLTRQLGARTMHAIVLSYLLDGLLLLGFALAGTVTMRIAAAYVAAGLAESGVFYLLLARLSHDRDPW